jgi:xylulokinase
MSTGLYLGLDVGTSASKAVLVDVDGGVVARGRATHSAASRTGRADAEGWWASAVEAIGQLGGARSETVAIGLSVHSPVLIPLDEDGEPLDDGYRFDAPGLAGVVSAAATAIPAEVHSRIGNAYSPATAIAGAYRLMQRTDVARASRVRWLGSVGSLLGQRLTGEVAIDPSQASYFGCFDVIGGAQWIPAAAEALGVADDLLPPVRPAGEPLGPLLLAAAAALGLPSGIPVTVAGGDTPSAAVAVGLDARSDTLLSLGTTHVLTRWRDRPDTRNRRLLQRPHLSGGAWLVHGATNGGLALAEGAAQCTGSDSATGAAVAGTIGSAASLSIEEIPAAPFFLPHVIAERGPLWLSEPAAGFFGDTAGRASDPRLAAWAVVEGVLLADRLVLEHMTGDQGAPLTVAADLSSGGEFAQLAADALNRELRVVEEPHLSALGAARLTAEVGGVTMPPVSASVAFVPRPERAALVDSRWQEWRQVRSAHLGL